MLSSTHAHSGTVSAGQRWHDGLDAMHWRILAASFMGWIFDGFESFTLFLVLPFALDSTLTPDQLASASPAVWAGLAISSTLLGWGIGGLAGGILADYIGRKRMMMYSVFLYALFTGLTALAADFWIFAGLRFLTGLAMGSEWSTGVALVAESWPDRARPKGCGILQSGFGWGTLLAALVWLILGSTNPLGAETWRLMFVVGALPALFVLYIRRNITESERWLAAVRERRWAATEEDARHLGAAAPAARRPFTLAEIFREPESRRRTILALLLSLSTTVGWWAISSWLPAYTEQLVRAAGYANPSRWATWVAILYTLGAIVAYLLSGFLADGIGRRNVLLFTYAGALIVTPITYFWTESPELLLLLVAFVNGFFTLGCAYSWMAIYLVELFTSAVRSTAASFVFNATRLIAWLFPILAAAMIQSFGGIPQAAMILGSIYALGLIVPWFMPETRGKPLPE